MGCLLTLLLAAFTPVDAFSAPLETVVYDFTVPGTQNGGNTIGNSWDYSAGSYDAELTGWSDLGSGFEAAAVVHIGDFASNPALGLGICNGHIMRSNRMCDMDDLYGIDPLAEFEFHLGKKDVIPAKIGEKHHA